MNPYKYIVLGLGILPFLGWLAALWFTQDGLGANPVEALSHESGTWTLRFLLLTLAMTPLARLGLRRAVSFRRMLGLFTFFYASVHFLVWFWLDRQLDWAYMLEDVLKRPYITVGFLAFLILLALAMTSNMASMRRLGRHWKTLHRGVYAAAVLGILHYLWLVKADALLPLVYFGIFALLMALRLLPPKRKKAVLGWKRLLPGLINNIGA